MQIRFVLLIFCFFVFAHCKSENNNNRKEFGEKKEENSEGNRSALNYDNRFSNSGRVINNKDSDHAKSHSLNTGEDERLRGSVTESSFERQTGETHGSGNDYDSKTNKNNSRLTDTRGQLFGSAPALESSQFSNNKDSSRHPNVQNSFGRPYEETEIGQQFQSRPSNQQGFSSGRPIYESTTYGQQTGFRPTQNGNNFSERPTEWSPLSSSNGFEAGNEGRPGPSENSTFGQSSALKPGGEGLFSGRPNEGSGFGHSSGLTNEGNLGSETQRPNSNEHVEQSHSENKPEGEQNQETKDGKEDDKDVCFTHLGCFKMGKPWKSTLRPIGAPHAPEKIQTVVHFYSRQNPKQPQNITVYPQVNIGRAQFDPRKISAMIVHGFSNSGNATWMKEMKDVYLRKVDANVMIVDWGKGAQLLNYLQVAGNTRVVGKQLGAFVKYLIEQHGADPGRFHLIGHSLGAQICSYLAKDVPGIARLTALDPAQPGFEGFSKEVRLDQTDAEFVDVIHTDARPFIPTLGFGMIAPHGHVDFYMNGGFDQPGCLPPPKKDLPVIKSFLDLAKFPVETIAKTIACPHGRAYEYLIEAFNETDNCIFWGHKTDVKNVFKTVTNTVTQGLFKKFTALSTTCSKDDCIPLGFATKKSPLRGAFVVTTSGRPPYCISEPGVPPETLPQDRKKKSMIEKIKESAILG